MRIGCGSACHSGTNCAWLNAGVRGPDSLALVDLVASLAGDALSGAGLVIVEQTAVEPAGRISHGRQGPRPEAQELLEVLADHRGIKPEQVFVGNGSGEGESR